jgi:hypothetical protein
VSRQPEPTEPADRTTADLSRRDLLRAAAALIGALALPPTLRADPGPDRTRLTDWSATLRTEGLTRDPARAGAAAARVGELAAGTPYVPGTLDRYLAAGASPEATEPLTLSLTRFDCVTLVEACLAVARVGRAGGAPTWSRFGAEIERMRYRGGARRGYASRLHYFSEWIRDGERRGLVRSLGQELGGVADERPLEFMTAHRASYRALADERVYREIGAVEHRLGKFPRYVVPSKRIPQIVDRLESGDVLGFATEMPGLDVTHAAFAYRDRAGTLRVLHAPLSGGSVEVTRTTLPEYVAAIRRATGVLVARPSWG